MPRADTAVTAVAVFRVGDADVEDPAQALASSASAGGAVRTEVAVLDGNLFEHGVAVTFADEERLDAWLDGPVTAALLADAAAAGWVLATPVLLVGAGVSAGPGVGAFRHRIEAGQLADFVAAQRVLTEAASRFAGYQGSSLFVDGQSGTALSVLRFRSDRTLTDWVDSAERQAALPRLRSSLSDDFVEVTGSTPFGTIVRSARGRTLMTPNWKSAMVVLLVLYPTVMTLSRFLGPILDRMGAAPWLTLWLSQVVSVALMQWWLMPWASRPFRRWLDPVDGAGRRSNVAGAVAVVVIYAATLTLFASVRWLQFWDFAD